MTAAPWRSNAARASLLPAPMPPVMATAIGLAKLLGLVGGSLGLGGRLRLFGGGLFRGRLLRRGLLSCRLFGRRLFGGRLFRSRVFGCLGGGLLRCWLEGGFGLGLVLRQRLRL